MQQLHRCCKVFLLLFAISLSRAAFAQVRPGAGRAVGVVTDLDDQPIAGALVRVYPAGQPDTGPAPARADAAGRWTIVGLAAGRWVITVKAEGFLTSEGWFHIRSADIPATVNVALRPLGEVTPGFATGPATVVRWIEKGNDLLEQGHYEEARREYEKALKELPPASRSEILRAIARTHFMQGDAEATVHTLRLALLLAPEDATTRQLFSAVLQQLGRGKEAQELIAALDRGGAEEALELAGDVEVPKEMRSASEDAPSLPEGADLPVEPAVAGRTGRFRTSFHGKSPHGSFERLLERLGLGQDDVSSADPERGRYVLQEETFQVCVPLSEAPPQGYGLLVWSSPGRFGGFVSDEVRMLLEERRLIWVGADNAGNERARWYRMLLALDAVHNIDLLYEIDPRRIYVAGYSGGGRVASSLALLYSEIFRGGFTLFGCDYFARVDRPDKPGAYWPPRFPPPSGDGRKRVVHENRFVLLTGELDFNRFQTKAIYRQMLDDGFEHVLFLTVPGASHYQAVERRWWDLAIDFLDGSDELGPE